MIQWDPGKQACSKCASQAKLDGCWMVTGLTSLEVERCHVCSSNCYTFEYGRLQHHSAHQMAGDISCNKIDKSVYLSPRNITDLISPVVTTWSAFSRLHVQQSQARIRGVILSGESRGCNSKAVGYLCLVTFAYSVHCGMEHCCTVVLCTPNIWLGQTTKFDRVHSFRLCIWAKHPLLCILLCTVLHLVPAVSNS